MEKRKVVQLVRLLGAREHRRFEKWLVFALDGKQRKTVLLYQLIRQGVSVEALWKSLYPKVPLPDRPFHDSGLRRLEHQLAVMVEKYLALEALERDHEGQDLLLIKELNQRNARQLFAQKLRKVRQTLDANPLRNERYFQQLYRLEREELHLMLKYNSHEVAAAFARLNQYFESWWVHEKLRMGLNAMNFRRVLNAESGSLLMDEVMAASQDISYLQDLPVLDLYRRLYLLLEGNEEPGDLFELLQRHGEKLGSDVLTDAFTLLLNHYTQRSNAAGKREDLERLFFIYEWGIREGYLLTDQILSWQHYKNLITVGLRLQKLELVWEYLHDLRELLTPKDAEEAFEFNLGKYYIAAGDDQQARRILARKFSNVFYEVSGRLALIKLRYEQGVREDLENELRALRVFVDRQGRLAPLLKTSWINEVRLIEKLIRAFSPADARRLATEIKETHPLGNRRWLSAQLEIMEKAD